MNERWKKVKNRTKKKNGKKVVVKKVSRAEKKVLKHNPQPKTTHKHRTMLVNC